jgi:ElaB/YqjD/DUF883 family membrane-anchored ribosome-binding protein
MPNSETTTSPFPTSATAGSGSMDTGGSSAGAMGADAGTVQRLSQRAHEAIDRLEQTVSSSSEKMMGWQQEYGDVAREQVRTNPLAAVGIAFAAGIVFSKLFLR